MSILAIFQNNVLDRAVKTFVQAFIAQYIVTVGQVDTKTLLFSAAAAGLSAVWSGVVSPLLTARKEAKLAKFIAAFNASVQKAVDNAQARAAAQPDPPVAP